MAFVWNIHSLAGIGLDMAVTGDIIMKHVGWLEVDSAEGQGTRMRVWPPVKGP